MKSNKGKFLAQVAFYLLFLGLLFYAASRTLHFVQETMPADQQYWGYLFLLATGVGAVIWLYVYLNWAEGAKQRGIAFAMGIIDLIGECVLVYADTTRVSGQNGLMSFNEQETRTFVIASVGIIVINIFAGFMFKLWDPEAERKGMSRDLTDDVSAAAFKELQTPESKQQMIAALKPALMASILSQVTSDVDEMIGKLGNKVIEARAYPATVQAPPILATPPTSVAEPAKRNPLPGPADYELADSIMPGLAGYRSCPKCSDIVPLTQTHCKACGHEMTPISQWSSKPAQEIPSYHPAWTDPKPKQEDTGTPPAPFPKP